MIGKNSCGINSENIENAIEVQNISKNYDGFQLQNVSFKVPKGSIMGFVGENGAGKTTTIKMLLNLIQRESGEIQILGLDNQIPANDKGIKKQIGVVLDGSNFPDSMTQGNIAKFMQKIFPDWDNELFAKYCQDFKLPRKKAIKEFSRGMKMKLSIAVALSHKPRLLILDEPTSGLDPIVRDDILNIFLDFIQDEEHSIFFSSHITGDIEKVADYVTFIHNGKIVFSESKDTIIYDYGILKCGTEDFIKLDKIDCLSYRHNNFGYEILVKNKEAMQGKYPDFIVDNATIEEVMIFFVKGDCNLGGVQ